MAFYKALGSGKLLKGGLGWLLNPFSAVWRRIFAARKAVTKHNGVGKGDTMGGTMIVRKGTAGIEVRSPDRIWVWVWV